MSVTNQQLIAKLKSTITELEKCNPESTVLVDNMCNGEGDSGHGLMDNLIIDITPEEDKVYVTFDIYSTL